MGDGAHQAGFIALALPFVAALLAPALTRLLRHHAAWILALFPAAIFAIVAGFADPVLFAQPVLFGFDWIPDLSIRFAFRLDGLSFAFALLISGIGTLIVLYAGAYMAGHPHQGRFLSFIFLFMGAMLGLVLADDLITLFVYWELTSITSFLLIGFDHEREAARRGAIQALVITGGGGLLLLAGLILIRETSGLGTFSALLGAGDVLRDSDLYMPILLLVLGGAFTKSAQVPFHVWLPNAMEAPTPVSAYLHSATMVKAGVYLLLRLNPVLGHTALWETILPAFGGVTLITGALLALKQRDLKLVLAYTTMASLGLLVMLIGAGSHAAIEGAVLYLIAHSMFKGGLFMVAGSLDHGAGTRDIASLRGLAGAMPVTFAAGLLGALSMGGLPPLYGFLAKEEIYAATAGLDVRALLLTAAAVAGNALMFSAAFLVGLKPFLGRRHDGLAHAHEGAPGLWIGPLLLGLAALFAGLKPTLAHFAFANPMASAALGSPAEIHAAVEFHWGAPLALSLLTVAIGVALYLGARRVHDVLHGGFTAIGWGPDRGFDQAMRGLLRGAFLLTHRLQSGRLDYYMTTTFAVIAVALLGSMAAGGGLPVLPAFPHLFFYEWTVLAILVVGVVLVLIAKNRLTAIVSLGIQGFAIALLFILLGAPDLSFTQFMVETLSVVVLALVMTRLRLQRADHRPWREVLPDMAVALAAGSGFGLFLLKVTQTPFDNALTAFFGEYSRAIAHGRNVVNVIIVDFRGLDTMGEIAVVMTTGLAILALIRIRVGRRGEPHPDMAEAPE
ncbi:putative monovalent cation/H+ antiporter subunit A [Aurantimonas sp. MSK8Z-1]|uniref:putative monovalent cation/H+ antiporter subunit A n=1 Tax=Mangrovibrevibacter kandeliae TaxID=2968473 RepID=UPI002118432F|nr:putative monovalent cation/H+ antiporter subunit A [Aurantimonas sp. MSK8Z-1]MCW4113650.1 putative monovalent cation/H+ antiporter subunit A [Aurantimonas sp. MSK8Z-1]